MKALMWTLVAVIAAVAVAGSLFLLTGSHGKNSSGSQDVSENDGELNSTGKDTYTLESDGVKREFIVYRPDNIPVTEETPVVFMFHGSGQSGELFYRESGWKDKADEEGLTVIYPTALKYHVYSEEKVVKGVVEQDVATYQTKWNAYELPGLLDPEYPNQELHDDVAFTKDMLAFVEDNYAIDTDRVYATGFSNGGQFTSRLAVEMPDVIAAFAPVAAGRIPDEILAKINEQDADITSRSIIQVIGANDAKLTHSAGLTEFPTTEEAAEDGNPVKDKYISGFLELEQLTDDYDYEEVGKAGHFTYTTSEIGEDAQYELYIVDNMGHVYPNGNNQPFDVANMFWDFFSQYSL